MLKAIKDQTKALKKSAKAVLREGVEVVPILPKEKCNRCRKRRQKVNLSTCPCCLERVCNHCRTEVTVLMDVLHPDAGVRQKKTKAAEGADRMIPKIFEVCEQNCADKCTSHFVAIMSKEVTDCHVGNVEAFLTGEKEVFYPRPDNAASKLDAVAMAKRAMPVAKFALKFCPYRKSAVLVAKGGIAMFNMSKTNFGRIFLSSQFNDIVKNILPILQRHFYNNTSDDANENEYTDEEDEEEEEDDDDEEEEDDDQETASNPPSSPTTSMSHGECSDTEEDAKQKTSVWNKTMIGKLTHLTYRLYYHSCITDMERLKQGTASTINEVQQGQEAPVEIMHRAGSARTVAAASWLYASFELKAPYNSAEWGAWYVGRLVEQQGAVLLACMGAGRAEKELFLPTRPHIHIPAWCLVANKDAKIATLAIRGTVTPSDMQIDSDAEIVCLSYPSASSNYKVHRGMLLAARTILDSYGARECLRQLAAVEYSIEIVGHSLGAGVATLIAVLLNLETQESDPRALRNTTCVAYAPPACVDEDLAKILQGRVLSIIHRDDLIPRLSEANCAELARTLHEEDDIFQKYFEADKACLKKYMLNLVGKSHSMCNREDKEKKPSYCDDDDTSDEDYSASRDSSVDEDYSTSCDSSVDEDNGPLRLVPPGDILYLKSFDSTYEAFIGNFDEFFTELGRIIITTRAISDHSMTAMLPGLRAVRWARDFPPKRQKPRAFTPAVSAHNEFVSCYCCGSDPAWTAWAPDSNFCRAKSTQNCYACGRVCCAFCAPAGDVVSGDGIDKKYTLPDLRISLPSMGITELVRVCRPCAYSAYTL